VERFFNESNSWTVTEGNEAWLYSDAAAYYEAFVNACEKAETSILIAGWDFHSDTVLSYRKRRGLRPKKVKLRRFLLSLARRKPNLHIYILTWDYAPFYMLERERLQSLRRGWLSHPRIHFHLDDAHPISASQHQKFVVVDAAYAFVGGLDLTIRRWDESTHSSDAPLRKDPYGEAYGAFHDYQLGVSGSVLLDFIKLFHGRWLNATGQLLKNLPDQYQVKPNPLPNNTAATFLNSSIGFSRTTPAFREQKELTEISELFKHLIAAAKDFIVIENQYLTSHTIVKSLSLRLKEVDGPEVIIILPEKAGGWLEVKTMGMLQDLALKRISENDPHGRLRIFYPYDRNRARHNLAMTVHSKIMIIDDRFFSIGSANLNNRSMGYDSECQLTIDATEDPFNRKAIERARAYVLAHHCEIEVPALETMIAEQHSLIHPIDTLCDPTRDRQLARFHLHHVSEKMQLEDLNWLDMEKPTELEMALDQWGFASELATKRLGVSPRAFLLGLTVIFAVLLGFAWHYFLKDPVGSEEALKRLLISPMSDPLTARLIMPIVFGIGAILFIPINLLIIITASFFTTGWAFLEILIGIIVNVCVGYLLGRYLGRYIFQRFFGKRTQKILDRIGKGQFLTILFIRIFPIAPSSLINLAAGSGKVPFLRFLAATILGMAPGTIMLVLFQKSIMDVFREPGYASILTIGILALITFVIFRWSRRRFSQYRQRS
jgi:phospholipase D1/2